MTASRKLYDALAKAIGVGIERGNVMQCILQVLQEDNPCFKKDLFLQKVRGHQFNTRKGDMWWR